MSGLERIYRIDQLLAERRFVPRMELQKRLGVSWATLKRDLAFLRDRLNAPIVYDRDLGGYRLIEDKRHIGPKYELPGVRFSIEELQALQAMQHLLSALDAGAWLGSRISPLLARLSARLGAATNPDAHMENRIRLRAVGARAVCPDHLEAVGSALVQRRRLKIQYHARDTNTVTEREISPQRLLRYRDNWYVESWCHLRADLRSFAMDAMKHVAMLEEHADDIPAERLDEVFTRGYGIFNGGCLSWAVLRFSPERSRWIAGECWHPDQKAHILEDGSCEICVPFSDERELVMEILRYGSDCKVVEPPALRERVVAELQSALTQYRTPLV